jgi:AraC-like DNA-binding protein
MSDWRRRDRPSVTRAGPNQIHKLASKRWYNGLRLEVAYIPVMSELWSYRPYSGASCIEMGRLETTRSVSQAVHFHSEVQVAAVAHGSRVYSTPLGDFKASPGDIIVIPAYLPHASYCGSASSITHLYVPRDHPFAHGIVVPQIIRHARAQSPSDILESMYKNGRRDGESATTLALPEQILDQELDIGSIAARLGYSTDGFIRAFKRQFGMTPAAYRLAHRLMTARSQLKKGGSIADVAYATCFADQSHFGRLFRRAYGTTPGSYRSAFANARRVDFVLDRRAASNYFTEQTARPIASVSRDHALRLPERGTELDS